MEQETNKTSFSDYIYIIFKWKWLLLSILLITIIITSFLTFLIPVKYKATTVITLPPQNSLSLSSLSGFSSGTSIGSRLFGIGNDREDTYLGILNSRNALLTAIDRFNLIDYYDIENYKVDKTLKAFSGDLFINTNTFGMIEISVINKDSILSADIANFLVDYLDSVNIHLNNIQAEKNREFIEARYEENVNALKEIEDSLYQFQKKYGIVAIPEQLEIAFQAAAEVESQLAAEELKLEVLKIEVGTQSQRYETQLHVVELLKKKVERIKKKGVIGETSNILFEFSNLPDIAINYLRLTRKLEIQIEMQKIILPIFEQFKLEETKKIPTITVIDAAIPPQLKDSPKRSIIVLIFTFLMGSITLVLVYRIESVLLKEKLNPLEEKEKRIYFRLKRFFKVSK